jgi:hypothetical protein
MTDDTSYSQLWLVDTQTNEKHVIYTTPLGSEIGPLMSWHPYDEKILYFVQYFSVEAEAKDWQLWRFDVTTMTAEAVSELFSEGFGLLIDWSATGDWLHLTAGKWSGSELQVDEIVINIQSGAVIHLGVDTSSDYFAWNPNQDEQYAVYRVSTRNADRDIEHISIFDLPKQSIAQRIALQLSTKHMEQIRNGFAPNIILGWQPQGTDLLVEAEGELYEYDTASEQWFALNVDSPTGIDNLIWSPGGSWVLLRRGSEILYSLPKDNLSHQPKRIVEDSHRILGWFDQLDWPIISMNDKIWLIDPGLTVSNIELYDLTTIGLDTSHSQQLAVLVVN